jgi:type I restriction enzyme S subunit
MSDLASLKGVPLTTFAEINPSRSPVALAPQDEVSFIPMSDVTESGRWVANQSRQYSEVRQGFTCFAEGDVLFAKITPCMENGKGCLVAGMINSVGFGSTEFHVLRARATGAAGFVYQWSMYEELRRQARNSMTGSAGQQRVPAAFFDTILVPELARVEQEKVGDILATVDSAIELTELLIVKQQRIKTGLMQELLTRGLDENGQIRSEQTHIFKNSPIGRIPIEWEVQELGTKAFVTKLAGFEFTKHFDYATGGDIIALRALNIKNEALDLHDVQRIPKATSDKLPRSKIFANDILITYIGAYIGDVLRIEEDNKFHLAPNIAKIVAGKTLNPRFLEIVLRSESIRRQIIGLTVTTATPSLTMTQIRKLFVVTPREHAEQIEIAKRIEQISLAVKRSQIEARKLYSLKTGLMQDLLTGNKRVTPLLEP